MTASYEIRETDGKLWKHAINAKGRVSEAASRVSAEDAEAMLSSGEARRQASKKSFARQPRGSYADHVRDLADNRPSAVQPRDWSVAMNRDE